MIFQETLFNETHKATDLYNLYQSQGLSEQTITNFQAIIYDYYALNERSFSWRSVITPYRVLVSEVMLQQTQTYRVAEKFDFFIEQFPDFQSLTTAPFEQVLRAWKGLGYNRRAMNLQKIATMVMKNFNGILPNSPEELVTFPGIGPATASSICAFAYNQPTIFIETNIRTVFIYFFYQALVNKPIDDKDLTILVKASIDQHNARNWYYALMDYGVMLKKTVGNLSKLSKHYTRQSKFNGSDRQIRGSVLQALLDFPELEEPKLLEIINKDPVRVLKIISQLINEGFIKQNGYKLNLH